MPISYPAWARRVLGKDPPKLSIKGYLQISFGYKSNTTATEGIQQVQGTRGGLFFDHNEMFAINGSIGRLINVEIKVGKEEKTTGAEVGNQIMDHLKIEYKPDPDSANQLEDDIIQEVVAGKTNFPMPGQGLAGYSGSHEGLFGIKVRSQLGPLSLTTIVSRENAESQEKTFDLTQNVSLPISETDYVRNVYFFLDSSYLKKYLNPAEAVPEIRINTVPDRR
jgi:cell surface protein SprA